MKSDDTLHGLGGSWTEFPPESQGVAWWKRGVPYTTDANGLQNLELWIPHKEGHQGRGPPALRDLKGLWIVYIHGGAWRDPDITSSSFTPTVLELLKGPGAQRPAHSKVAAFVSINYSLSPYPDHPTDPGDSSRTAEHPDHIHDVLRALGFLQRVAQFDDNYLLLGHSCGATLAFQILMDAARWEGQGQADVPFVKPKAILGLNGLYDLPALVHRPGQKHESLIPVYAQFIKGAFGEDEQVWQDASPVHVQDWMREWGRADALAVVVQSKEDTLVPYRQTRDLIRSLEEARGKGLRLVEMAAGGDHDDMWEKPNRLASIIDESLDML